MAQTDQQLLSPVLEKMLADKLIRYVCGASEQLSPICHNWIVRSKLRNPQVGSILGKRKWSAETSETSSKPPRKVAYSLEGKYHFRQSIGLWKAINSFSVH